MEGGCAANSVCVSGTERYAINQDHCHCHCHCHCQCHCQCTSTETSRLSQNCPWSSMVVIWMYPALPRVQTVRHQSDSLVSRPQYGTVCRLLCKTITYQGTRLAQRLISQNICSECDEENTTRRHCDISVILSPITIYWNI